MANPRHAARRTPQLHINTEEILTHAAAAQATACADCRPRTVILAGDIALLLAEITRLHQSLIQARQRAANFEAAIRAAIGARKDGDHDPIGYLRDELIPGPGGAYGA